MGQGGIYVGYINYLFEGKNHIQLAYLKTDDEDYRDVSYMHGAKTHVNEKRFTLRNPKSRILHPGIANNDTKNQLLGFMFVEYFDDGATSEPWTIAAFDPVNAPYY